MRPIPETRGDKDATADQLGQQGKNLGLRFRGIDVVQDQQPAGVLLQPAQNLVDRPFLGCLLLQVQQVGPGEGG